MSIDHFAFCELPLAQQLPLVWQQGTFLAARLVEQQLRTLYHLHTFFCELHYDATGKRVLAIRCYPTTRGLDDYLDWVQLPALRGLF